jgi:outer membrane protein assembly factor BamB
MLRVAVVVGVVIVCLLRALAVQGEDWPEWRGPHRDNVWSETDVCRTFPEGGMKVSWRAPVEHGYSSPVVAAGRVYVTDSHLEAPKAQERVLCFEESSGKPLWTFSQDVAYPDWAFTPGNEKGPNSTPIVRDGKVYVYGSLGMLLCLDARAGGVLWQRDMAKEHGFDGLYATSASPLIDGKLLILVLTSGGKCDASVVALDRDTGKEVWKALEEPPGHSSPIVIEAGGTRQLIVWTQESVTSLEPATGKVLWREKLTGNSDYVISTPVYSSGRLLIAGLMMKLDADKPGAKVLWPESRAVSRRVLSNTSTGLLRGDNVFSAKSSGELVCLDAATGKQVWETDKLTDMRGGASIHLTLNGDSVLAFNERGELIRAELTAEGYREISRARVIEPTYAFGGRKLVWTAPAYANRHVFARTEKELVSASLEKN